MIALPPLFARFSVSAPLAGLCLALAAGPVSAAGPPHGPTLATEDTMRTEVPEVLVRAPRVTLEEILDRVARGESHRDSLIHDQVYTFTARLVRNVVDTKHAPELVSEDVVRVYKKKPGKVRGVPLRRWRLKPEKDDDNVEFDFRSDTSEEIVNFAFRPEARRQFKYRIVGRDLLGDRLIYRIAFEPRSALDAAAPSGVVWVNTNDFVIVHQEVNFEHSPVPLILKSVDRMVVERESVDGIWVLKRVLLRARFTMPLPEVGRSIDLAIAFSDYAINQGIDDSVFAGKDAK
jgi:hypothetical protein